MSHSLAYIAMRRKIGLRTERFRVDPLVLFQGFNTYRVLCITLCSYVGVPSGKNIILLKYTHSGFYNNLFPKINHLFTYSNSMHIFSQFNYSTNINFEITPFKIKFETV